MGYRQKILYILVTLAYLLVGVVPLILVYYLHFSTEVLEFIFGIDEYSLTMSFKLMIILMIAKTTLIFFGIIWLYFLFKRIKTDIENNDFSI